MPSPSRYYSSNAAKTTLADSISSSATSLTLSAASNLPAQYPYTLILEKDTANEEVIEVTSLVGSSYQITRNIDSSGAKAHAVGANVEHGVSARDFTESRSHEIATTSVHGVSGDVVGTSGAQTLASKTLTTPTINGATISGTFTSTATISGGTITGAIITGLATPTASSSAATKGYIDTSVTSAAASATAAATSASSASTSASSAATSAASAETSAISSATSATAAATSAASASTSATSAQTYASTMATSVTSAATSATSAATSASSALTSQTAAATSATSAAASATAAATSATSAATSAGTALTQATAATTSATSAATSASSALTSATSASASATAAATSVSSASTSASSALTSQTAAATSATSAATSASSAATSAASSLTSQSSAATSQSSAATSASSAATSQTAAATSASSASTSASSAATSATSSATSAALAASIVAGAIQGTLFDAKGDLLVGTADDAVSRLAVGANGYLLTADSSEAKGIKWAAAPVSLPSQTGNTGKLLVTDGTTASWAGAAPIASPTEPTTLIDGLVWVDTDGTAPTTVVTRWTEQPAAGTTVLTGNDDYSIPLAYSPGYEQVFLNGVLLSRSGSEYTATNGTSITLATATVAGDIVEVICPLQIATTDTYTQSAVNNAFQANTNNFAAGKNKIINGDFNINQRAFTSTTTSTAYGFDRWTNTMVDGTVTYSSQAFTPGAAPVSGYESINYCRFVTTGQTLITTQARLKQHIENVRTFAGQTITLSFWAKANTGTPNIAVSFSQVFGTGGSGTVSNIGALKTTITTGWDRYSFTISVPSISGKTVGTDSYLQLNIWFSAGSNFDAATNTMGIQSNTFDIWGVQVEQGSVATAFQTATGTIQGELAACQRYYFRPQNTDTFGSYADGYAQSTTSGWVTVSFPTSMRTKPSSIDYSSLCLAIHGALVLAATSVALDAACRTNSSATLNVIVASGLVAGYGYTLANNNNTNGFIAFNAEL